MAVSWSVNPSGTVEVAGATAMEASTTATPVPESFTFCGVLLASSFTLRIPACGPAAVGENTMKNAHCSPGVRLLPQGLSCTKKLPVAVTLEIFRTFFVEFVSVTGWELGEPTN